MSYEESLRSISLNADASIGIYTGVPGLPGSASPNSGKQYRFLKVTGADTVGLATGAALAIGVLQNKPQNVGMASTVAISGVTNVVADAVPIAAGAGVEVGANAGAATLAAGVRVGTALRAASTVGELLPVLLA
jgi:hypothetical protein